MLRTARRYDPETNTVVFGDGTPFTSTSMAFGGLQGYVDIMFDFSKGMSSLFVDNAEYSLLTAMCIFSCEFIIYFENIYSFHATRGLDNCSYEVPPHIPEYLSFRM